MTAELAAVEATLRASLADLEAIRAELARLIERHAVPE